MAFWVRELRSLQLLLSLSPQALLLCKWVRKMRTTKRSSCQQMPCSYCFLRVLGLIHFFALFVLTCSQLWARMWLPQHIGHHTKSPLLCGQNASDLTDNSLAHAFAISSGTVAVWAVLDDLLSPFSSSVSFLRVRLWDQHNESMKELCLVWWLPTVVCFGFGIYIHRHT